MNLSKAKILVNLFHLILQAMCSLTEHYIYVPVQVFNMATGPTYSHDLFTGCRQLEKSGDIYYNAYWQTD